LSEIPTSSYGTFVSKGILETLERKDKERDLVVKLFASVGKEGLVTKEHFISGFDEVLESIEELDVDIPYASQYLSIFLGHAVANSFVPLSYLNKALEPLIEGGKAKKILLHSLTTLVGSTGVEKTAEQIKEESLELEKLTGAELAELKSQVQDKHTELVPLIEKLL